MAKYDAIRAFARGMMEALIEKEDAPKQPRVNVAKTDDIEAAVKKYLDEALYGGHVPDAEPEAPPDAHEYIPPEMARVVRDMVGDLGDIPPEQEDPRSRFYKAPNPDAGTYDANEPGETGWAVPPKDTP